MTDYKIVVSIEHFPDPQQEDYDGDIYRIDIYDKETGELLDCDTGYHSEEEARASWGSN